MSTGQIIEIAVAVAMILGAVALYRRNSAGERRGSQGAVFLLLVGIIVLMHGLGLFEYQPSQAEIQAQ